METSADNACLLVIDVQKGLDDPKYGRRNNPDAEANIAKLLAEWRRQNRPVIHIHHKSVRPDSPLRPDHPGNAVKEEARPLPSEIILTKTINSAFIGTGLYLYLQDEGISSLVIVGLTTDHCVSASTRNAADLGFEVTVVSDATAAHEKEGYDGIHYSADDIHKINLVSLDGEFCTVRSTEDLLKEIA